MVFCWQICNTDSVIRNGTTQSLFFKMAVPKLILPFSITNSRSHAAGTTVHTEEGSILCHSTRPVWRERAEFPLENWGTELWWAWHSGACQALNSGDINRGCGYSGCLWQSYVQMPGLLSPSPVLPSFRYRVGLTEAGREYIIPQVMVTAIAPFPSYGRYPITEHATSTLKLFNTDFNDWVAS